MPKRPRRHKIHTQRVYVVRVNLLRRWYRRIALLLFILALPAASYYATLWYFGESQRSLVVEHNLLKATLSGLQAKVLELEQANANLKMDAEMDAEAEQHLRDELISWRERTESLQSEVQFYLSLMEPATSDRGVFISSAGVQATEESNVYRYSLVIGQKSQDHPRIIGSVTLRVISESENQYTVLGLADLTDQGAELPLGFKFFQQMDGTLYLPAGFKPSQWTVDVQIAGSAGSSITETYDWPFSGQ